MSAGSPPADQTTPNPGRDGVNRLWGGRFASGPSAIMADINTSVSFDRQLWPQDIAGSKAHARMLGACGIITAADAARIQEGLDCIASEIASGTFTFKAAYEDVHMNIEARLAEVIGQPAGRLHTARSRNDQVATDLRLWVRDAIDHLDVGLRHLQSMLIDKADRFADAVMPGYTHLQPAQPVTLGHHLMAYVEMFGRDRGRFADARRRLNECPLGSAALAGTAFPIDREMVARELGFDRPSANSMDSVSDRDFALEYLAAAAILSGHLSRLAEEIILWTSDAFGFAALSDAFTTGSSIMPQKRNADAAELVRAKTGRVTGALVGLLTVVKALPLTYAKDMQEDKEPLFDTDRTLALTVAAITAMIADLTPNRQRMEMACLKGHMTATDLADWLVRAAGIPFREAHHITGRAVQAAEAAGKALWDMSPEELQQVDPRIDAGALAVLPVLDSVSSRTSQGGSAPVRVREAAAKARTRYL